MVVVLLTEEQVANRLGMKVSTLRNRRARGENHPPYIQPGRSPLYPEDALETWVRKNLVHASS